jgi:hypothetical protein
VNSCGRFEYDDDVQKTIATELENGKTIFDVLVDGEISSFDFIKMIETTKTGQKYAIREANDSGPVAYSSDLEIFVPFEKTISDKVCEAIKKKITIDVDIDEDKSIIYGHNKKQIQMSTGLILDIIVIT